jgi:site-specific DNA-cytosine methylase
VFPSTTHSGVSERDRVFDPTKLPFVTAADAFEGIPWNPDGDLRARRLRVPEMLLLMTFPDGFKLAGSRSDAQTQLGNAVPVKLGAIVVRSLLVQLGYLSPRSAEEELMADMRHMRQRALF